MKTHRNVSPGPAHLFRLPAFASLLTCEGECGEHAACTSVPQTYRVWDVHGVEQLRYVLCDQAANEMARRGYSLVLAMEAA